MNEHTADKDAALWSHAPRTYAEQRALLEDSLRNIPPTKCCCESSPPELGGNLPDRECPLHGGA